MAVLFEQITGVSKAAASSGGIPKPSHLEGKTKTSAALKKLIREDNTEVSLAQLQKKYGKPEDIKSKAKKTKLLSDKEKQSLTAFEKIKPPSKALIANANTF